MIIVRLTGGLGNQMFQYAAARSLADSRNTVLKLDTTVLEVDSDDCTPRSYMLGHFPIGASVASSREVAEILGDEKNILYSAASLFCRAISSAGATPRSYNERYFSFDPAFLNLPDNTYLAGYWQSEKYFLNIRDIIKREFTLLSPLDIENNEVANLINTTSSVSLHVRRGDFVNDAKVNRVHGVCTSDYYRRSIEKIVDLVGEIHLFVFSDDPSWVSENYVFPCPATVVKQNPSREAHKDLWLMNLCRHHIIANSTFSWWGAWLSSGPDKVVIAPERWFNDPSLDTRDLIPSDWLRL